MTFPGTDHSQEAHPQEGLLRPDTRQTTGPHRCRFRVYYEDTDALGIVYYGRYLGFAERARAEALRDLGMPIGWLTARRGVIFVVRTAELAYRKPFRLDEEMEIRTFVDSVRGARLGMRQEFWRGEELAVRLVLELACMRAPTDAGTHSGSGAGPRAVNEAGGEADSGKEAGRHVLQPVRIPSDLSAKLRFLQTDDSLGEAG